MYLALFIFSVSVLYLLPAVRADCKERFNGRRINSTKKVIALISLTSTENQDSVNLDSMLRVLLLLNMVNSIDQAGIVAIDVCDNETVVQEILLDILLHNNTEKPIGIVTYLSSDMTRLTAAILLPFDIFLLSFTSDHVYPRLLTEQEKFVFSYDLSVIYGVENVISSLEMANVSLVSFLNYCFNDQQCSVYDDTIEPYKNMKNICIKGANIKSKKEFQEVVKHIERDERLRLVFITGELRYIASMDKDFLKIGRHPMATVFLTYNLKRYCKNNTLRFAGIHRTFKTNCSNIKNIIVENTEAYFLIYFTQFITEMVRHGDSNFTYETELKKRSIALTKTLKNHTKYNPTCVKPNCGMGEELRYGNYADKIWKHSYGWYCRRCKGNSIKETEGDAKCQPCENSRKANALKTSCEDPFHDVFIRYGDKMTHILLIVSMALLLCVIAVTMVFLRYRRTPVVVASNIVMTSVQLLSQATQIGVVPFMYIGKPTDTVCMCRPVVIGIFLSLILSATLSKTQRLLQIFQAKLRMNRMEILQTSAVQYIGIFLSILIDCCLLVVSFQYEKPKAEIQLDFKTMKRRYFCNSELHTHVQFAYAVFLLLVNSVQGFRARRFPESFRETIYITFSSFTCFVAIGVMSGIYYSQAEYYMKDFVIMYALLVLNFIELFLLNGYKVFVIFFRPSRNNSNSFQTERMRRIEKNVQRMTTLK